MRNIATCYSEHAVKVSDSYCSGPLNKTYISPKPTPSIQTIVSCTYKAQIPDKKRVLFITITWCSKLVCQGFFIKFSETNNNQRETTTTTNNNNNVFQHGFHHQMPNIKGNKVLQHEKLSVSIHWDLSQACFDIGPKPITGYYIAIVLDSKLSLLIGDMRNDSIVQDLVRGLSWVENLSLVSQCEHFYARSLTNNHHNHPGSSNQIVSKARFKDSGDEHEIMIKCGTEDEGPRNPAISVYIDKKRVVRVKRLQWNFRGNQVIFVDGLLVDVMWDVFGWYFDQTVGRLNCNNHGNGFIMFRTRSGLDSRLWLEEEEVKLADKIKGKPEFSLLICASNKNPG